MVERVPLVGVEEGCLQEGVVVEEDHQEGVVVEVDHQEWVAGVEVEGIQSMVEVVGVEVDIQVLVVGVVEVVEVGILRQVVMDLQEEVVEEEVSLAHR